MLETTDIGKTRLENVKKEFGTEKSSINLRTFIARRHRFFFAKRAFDIVVSSLVILLVFSWLFPILFLLIKLDSRGPLFFVQRRVGFLGRSFSCLKFRTMRVNAEANSKQATEHDPRITRVGHFLRNSSLDELPQFLNVLMGQMSVVGPRPHMYKDCASFSAVVDAYKFRTLVKPGITGLAQVKGYRGPARTFDKIFRRYQWDAFYVRNANFWLDVRIIYATGIQTLAYFVRKFIIEEVPTVTISPDLIEPQQANAFN